MQKTHLYRVNLYLKRSGENSHPSVCCFLLLINTFLLVFVNIFLQLEANPVQMRLLYNYPVVLVNSKMDYYIPGNYASGDDKVQKLAYGVPRGEE